jgi:hypothetical protein
MKQILNLRYRLASLFLAVAPFATASLLLNPAGGSSVGLTGEPGFQVTRNIGGTFSLFRAGITSINISSEGSLGTGQVAGFFADRNLSEIVSSTGGPVIAPFYDGLTFGNGSAVTDQSVKDTYYAVTYQSMYGLTDASPGHTSDFQVVMFMADTTIKGFQFHAGDIGISYGTVASTISGSTFTVGIGSSTISTGTPTSLDGQLSNFSTLPTGSQFFLYRPRTFQDMSGPTVAYNVSLESASAPEPAALALAGVGLVALASLKRRKSSV